MNQNQTQNKIFEEAAKKLQSIEKNQRDAEKYFKARENNENKLKLLESNLKKKVKLEKRSSLGFEEKTLDKLQNLLKNLSSIDLNLLNKFEDKTNEKLNKLIQTDQEDIQMIQDKLSNLEKENEKNINKKTKYKKENEMLKIENENLKNINEKYNKENIYLQNNLEEVSKIKLELENRLREAKNEKEKFNIILSKNEEILRENEELKKVMEEKLEIEKETIELEVSKEVKNIDSLKGSLKILLYFNELHQVTKFLNVRDINNLKQTAKLFYSTIEKNHGCMKNYYKNIIGLYKKRVNELNSLDLKKEYMVNDMEVERLLKDYVKANKLAGKELKPLIIKALNFMAKDVKAPLGIKSTVSNTPKTVNSGGVTGSNQGGYFGGIGSLIGGMFHKQQQPQNSPSETKQMNPNSNSHIISMSGTPKGLQSVTSQTSQGSKASSRGMSIIVSNEMPFELEKYDRFLISENINPLELIDFEYSTPDEIKLILNKFLKSNFSTEKLTQFIKEICLEYSELLFFANKSLNEIRELEIVKNALNERYRRYHKLCQIMDNELTDIKKSMLTQSSENNKNKIESDEKLNIESKYYSALNEMSRLKEQNEVSELKLKIIMEREDQIYSEYESFKVIFMKEIRNLKYDLDDTIRQRNNLRDLLIEFKNYFLNNAQINNSK